MPAFNTLFAVQITLITIGVIFQLMAMAALHKDSGRYQEPKKLRSDESNTEAHDTYALNGSARRQSARVTRQRNGSHDYYEIERTPPGVPPSELTKTAKVLYFD